jgi:hypothetical protein
MNDFQEPGSVVSISTRKAASGEPTGKPQRFPLVKFDDVLVTTTSFYLVKNLIPRVGLVVIWGPPKCGKSFWTFDILMHVACGWPYRGLRVKAGAVVYCVLEGANGFKRRVEAFRRKYPKSKGAPFYLMVTPLDLIKDHKALIASIRAQLPKDVNPAAVCIDTLNRSLVGSESSDEDMAAYVRAADAIRDAFDCAVPIIHHCGHNADRPRGHSSLLGAADVQIAVKREGPNTVAQVEFAKDGPTGLEIVSRLVPVDVGKDEDDDIMTSLIIEPVGELAEKAEPDPKPKRLTNAAQNALRALHMAIDEMGEIPPASNHIPQKVKTVTISQWRDYAFRTGVSGSGKAHAKGTAFNRAPGTLLAARKIAVWDPHVWPAQGNDNAA